MGRLLKNDGRLLKVLVSFLFFGIGLRMTTELRVKVRLSNPTQIPVVLGHVAYSSARAHRSCPWWTSINCVDGHDLAGRSAARGAPPHAVGFSQVLIGQIPNPLRASTPQRATSMNQE